MHTVVICKYVCDVRENIGPQLSSGILQVQADVRTILSRDFATRHSLRFPRVERIRYDKSPFDVQTDQQLWDLVNQNKGANIGSASYRPKRLLYNLHT